ncbi:MAG TPA: hypothetical protein VF791_04420 [Pyrinomonadaceae bacterium]
MKKYPDVTELLKRKAAHRRALAALTFEEKIELVFRLQERRRFMKSGVPVKPSGKTRKAKVNGRGKG